jgi:hypothetical protein
MNSGGPVLPQRPIPGPASQIPDTGAVNASIAAKPNRLPSTLISCNHS